MREAVTMDTEKETTFSDYWKIVYKNKKTVISIFIFAEILTFIFTALSPRIYESTASVLPPEIENPGMTSLSSLGFRRTIVGGTFPDLFGGTSTSDTVIAMLKSRRMAEDIVKKFELQKIYGKKLSGDAIGKLKSNTRIKQSREYVISITVESEKKDLASQLANFYVSNLNTMNDELELTSAKPIVRVLDVARPAERKSKPSLRLNLFFAAVLSVIAGILVVFGDEYLLKRKRW